MRFRNNTLRICKKGEDIHCFNEDIWLQPTGNGLRVEFYRRVEAVCTYSTGKYFKLTIIGLIKTIKELTIKALE